MTVSLFRILPYQITGDTYRRMEINDDRSVLGDEYKQLLRAKPFAAAHKPEAWQKKEFSALSDAKGVDAVMATDCNGDAYVDLIVRDKKGKENTVYFNDGAGGFPNDLKVIFSDEKSKI